MPGRGDEGNLWNTDSDSAGESLLDFVASDTLLCVRSEQFALGRIDAVCSETFSTSSMLADEGDANALKNLVDPERFHARWETFAKIHFSGEKAPDAEISDEPQPQNSTAAPAAKLVTARGTATLDFGCTPQGLYHKNFDLISASFTHLLEQGYTLYILSDSEKQIERLRAIFDERGDKIPFTPVLSTLHEGFVTIPSAPASSPTTRFSTASTNIPSRGSAPARVSSPSR